MDDYLTLAQAARRCPKINAKHPSPNAMWRWWRRGVRGERLECWMIGGRAVTTEAALEDFFRRVAEAERPPRPPRQPEPATAPRQRTAKQRERDIARAERELREAGCRI